MNENILLAKCDYILKVADNIDANELMVILCMFIDYTASRNDMPSEELLEKITPTIIQCNEDLGAMEL